jgi:hypothetical protein
LFIVIETTKKNGGTNDAEAQRREKGEKSKKKMTIYNIMRGE